MSMQGSMSDLSTTDAITGLDIEHSLKSKFNSLGFGNFESEQSEETDVGNLKDLDDLGDTIHTIPSESSGVISGKNKYFTSISKIFVGLTSGANSAASIVNTPRNMTTSDANYQNHRLKSAMVRFSTLLATSSDCPQLFELV